MGEKILIGGKTRTEKLEEYRTWSVEKLATALVKARVSCQNERARAERYFREIHADNGAADILRDSNNILRYILGENGIIPTKLRITYYASDCINCPSYNAMNDECENYDPWNKCPLQKCVISESFYTYGVDDGKFNGINASLESKGYDLISIADERTGEIIWRNEDAN